MSQTSLQDTGGRALDVSSRSELPEDSDRAAIVWTALLDEADDWFACLCQLMSVGMTDFRLE